MTKQDHEAFEAWLKTSSGSSGEWATYSKENMQQAWEAARSHYAPKLTQKEAKRIISEAMHDDDSEGRVLNRAVEALRAAGIKFRDEA